MSTCGRYGYNGSNGHCGIPVEKLRKPVFHNPQEGLGQELVSLMAQGKETDLLATIDNSNLNQERKDDLIKYFCD